MPALRRLGRRLLWLYLALTAVGMIVFVVRPTPHPWTPETPGTAAEGRTNWASVRAGARVRADHWDYFRSHHPLFLIDGEERPSGAEKWASLHGRRFPWVEIGFDGLHDVDEVVITHAGWFESTDLTNERYVVRCYRGDALIGELGVTDNTESIAEHPLECPQVDRLRLDLDCTGSVDVARIYEIEAWGP